MVKIKKEINKPVWLKYTEPEVKEIILNLIKKTPELTSEKIGMILRDNYGIPKTRIYKLKISRVLKEAGVYKNPDLENLKKRLQTLEAHLSKNKADEKAGKSLISTKSKLKKVQEYSGSK